MPADISTTRHHFHGLDGLRGVAAVIVAILHMPFLGLINVPEAFLAVDLFFVLSGVVLCEAYASRLRSDLSLRSFLTLRLIRLYPLYLLGTLIGLAGVAIGADAMAGRPDITIILALAMLPNLGAGLYPLDGPAWSLFFEIVASAAYGVMTRGARRVLIPIILVCGLGVALQCIVRDDHSLDIGWTTGTLAGGLLKVGFSFSMGVLLHHIYERCARSSSGRWSLGNEAGWCLVALLAVLLGARPQGVPRALFEIGMVLAGFPLLVFAMLFVEPHGLTLRLFKRLGAVSYPLYVLHAPAARIAETFGPSLGLTFHPHGWAATAFLPGLIGLCLWLDGAFDRPVRARLMLRSRPEMGRDGAQPSPVANLAGSGL